MLRVEEAETGDIEFGVPYGQTEARFAAKVTLGLIDDDGRKPTVILSFSVPFRDETLSETLGRVAYRAHQALAAASALTREQLAELVAEQLKPKPVEEPA